MIVMPVGFLVGAWFGCELTSCDERHCQAQGQVVEKSMALRMVGCVGIVTVSYQASDDTWLGKLQVLRMMATDKR